MKRFGLVLTLAAVSIPAFAQHDACRGAVSLLNRVKEEITPDLSKADPAGRDTLSKMQASLEQATNVCKNLPELWYERSIVETRLGIVNKYVRDRAAPYKADFDPFTPPPNAQPPNNSTTVQKKWALIVGINEFNDPAFSTLRYAAKDASDFADFLQEPKGGRFDPSRVRRLLNTDATLGGIREGIGWLRKNVHEDDLVVLYFAGHGSPRTDDPNGMSYIITHDTSMASPEKLYATSVQMVDLVQQLNRDLKATRVILFLDTCFSGDATGSRGMRPAVWSSPPPPEQVVSAAAAFSGAIRILTLGSGRAVITASRADEFSQESPVLKNGYFTHYLIETLRAGDGQPRLGVVYQEVRDRVSKAVKHDISANQTPSSNFTGKAESFVLGVPEADAPRASNASAH